MRLKNVPGSREAIADSVFVIQDVYKRQAYEIPVVDQLNAEQHYVMDLKMNADGTTAVIYDDSTEEESVDEFGKHIRYIVISPEGETTELTLPLPEDEYARNVWVSPEGDCYFASVSAHTLYRVKKGETEGTPFLTIDEDACIRNIQKYPHEIGVRASKEFFDIHGTNARFMEEEKL